MAGVGNFDLSVLPSRDSCVRPPSREQGNPRYPLPPNFHKLTEAEKSWWRVNACCIQDTPADFVIAYTFFFYEYLFPKESGFLENARESPDFHYQMVHDIAAFKLNVFAAPRGACKSTLMRIVILLLMLTRRQYRIGGVFSIQKKARESVSKIRRQLERNPLIRRDFGVCQPKRGAAETWSNDTLEMAPPFGNNLWSMCLQGASRGGRFDWVGIDDAELDPTSETVVMEWVAKLERQIKQQFLPMIELSSEDLKTNPEIARRGTGVCMFGTVIQENMMLARIVDAPPGSEYDFWNRWRFMQHTDDSRFLWLKRWGPDSSNLMREVMTDEYFATESLNRPGALSKGRFHIHPQYSTYAVDKPDDDWFSDPCSSQAIVKWAVRSPDGVDLPDLRTMPVWEWLQPMDRAIVVDWADTERVRSTNDCTCIHVLGNDSEACVWSLDMKMGRFTTDEAAQHVVDLCMKWLPSRIVMESIAGYSKISDMVSLAAFDQLLDRIGWVPTPHKLNYNSRRFSKGARIDRIAWRWGAGKLRLPINLSREWPYNELWHQIHKFTVDLKGLRYDDGVDTLGMIPEVFRGKGGRPLANDNAYVGVPINELLAGGRLYTDDGRPLVEALPFYGCLSPEAADALELDERKRSRANRFQTRKRQFSGRPV